jgi:hypothetical protein
MIPFASWKLVVKKSHALCAHLLNVDYVSCLLLYSDIYWSNLMTEDINMDCPSLNFRNFSFEFLISVSFWAIIR